MRPELESNLVPDGNVLPAIGTALSGDSMLLLAVFYIALVALYLLLKRRYAGRVATQNSMEVIGQLAIGRRGRIIEVATRSGIVIVVFSDNGVAITEVEPDRGGMPTFQSVLQEEEARAA